MVGHPARRKATTEFLGWYGAAQADSQAPAEARNQYSPPQLRKLTAEQAKLVLIGHAMAGDQGAKELMGVLFPAPESRAERRAREGTRKALGHDRGSRNSVGGSS